MSSPLSPVFTDDEAEDFFDAQADSDARDALEHEALICVVGFASCLCALDAGVFKESPASFARKECTWRATVEQWLALPSRGGESLVAYVDEADADSEESLASMPDLNECILHDDWLLRLAIPLGGTPLVPPNLLWRPAPAQQQQSWLMQLPDDVLACVVLARLPRREQDTRDGWRDFLSFYGTLPLVCKSFRELLYEEDVEQKARPSRLGLSPYHLYVRIAWAEYYAFTERTWHDINAISTADEGWWHSSRTLFPNSESEASSSSADSEAPWGWWIDEQAVDGRTAA